MKSTSPKSFIPDDPVTDARAALLEAARDLHNPGDSLAGDVIAAALRYTAEVIKGWGYNDLAKDLEKTAQRAEKH
jgi:hypothetical protein